MRYFNKLHYVIFTSVILSVSCLHSGSLYIKESNMTVLNIETLAISKKNQTLLQDLYLIDVPYLETVDITYLKRLPNLRSLCISQAPRLERLDQLPPLSNLNTLRIMNSGLIEVPDLSKVHSEDNQALFHSIDLEGNHIKTIKEYSITVRAAQLSLNYNLLESIPAFAFNGSAISELFIKGNLKLTYLDPDAFSGMTVLTELDLSNTAITQLPVNGLEQLEVLKIEQTQSLKTIPSIYDLENLKSAYLTHPFHCCAFAYPEIHDKERHELYLKFLEIKCKQGFRRKRSMDTTGGDKNHLFYNFENSTNPDITNAIDSNNGIEGQWGGDEPKTVGTTSQCGYMPSAENKVYCQPQPDPLSPCEDVMGWVWLRVCVWLVVGLAVFGNVAVLVVLMSRPQRTAPQLLMLHLATADLATGVYLLMLAVVDLTSFGEYFNFAYDWQYGVGCKIAGFFSIFSGQLSVYTLAAVTLERWFAITYAIYLERRLGVTAATKIMIGGWVYAIVLAALPLLGVSSYSSTSICIPVSSKNIADGIYQAVLIVSAALAWSTIVTCYVRIYRSIGGGAQPCGAATVERRLANKMALLILTNLLCWAPVGFFGATALAGSPLINISSSKFLLVFIYPLNACANPFLYALLTEQFKHDAVRLWSKLCRSRRDKRRDVHTQPTPLLLTDLKPELAR